jgi:hypothetical protein
VRAAKVRTPPSSHGSTGAHPVRLQTSRPGSTSERPAPSAETTCSSRTSEEHFQSGCRKILPDSAQPRHPGHNPATSRQTTDASATGTIVSHQPGTDLVDDVRGVVAENLPFRTPESGPDAAGDVLWEETQLVAGMKAVCGADAARHERH